MNGDTTKVIHTKEQLNKLGYPTLITYHDSLGVQNFKSINTYKNDSLRLTVFNELIDYRMVFDYNMKDRVISITNFIKDVPSVYEKYTYRKDGRIKTNEQFSIWNKNNKSLRKKTIKNYEYKDKDNVLIIHSKSNLKGKRETRKSKLIIQENDDNTRTKTIIDERNPEGIIIENVIYDNSKNVLIQEFIYRSNGTIDDGVRKINYDVGDTLKFQYIYGKNGLTTNRVIYKNHEVVDIFEYKYL